MKIMISAEGVDLESHVAHRFGISHYMILIDSETMAFEAVPNSGATAQRGAGMQAVVFAISNDVKAVLTGYCSPAAYRQLTANGIEVFTGLSGRVGEVLEKYKKGELGKRTEDNGRLRSIARIDSASLVHALTGSTRQFANLLPMLISVVLLIGLFNTFMSKGLLSYIFSKSPVLDTLFGTCFGSIMAGNPINSYVIGAELLNYGVSLLAVTGFIIAWVTVGIVQLPAEIAALGAKFALLRNALCFALAILIAFLTTTILFLVSG